MEAKYQKASYFLGSHGDFCDMVGRFKHKFYFSSCYVIIAVSKDYFEKILGFNSRGLYIFDV